MLSNTSKYALRAVIYLAANAQKNQKIGIKQIAGELDIPTPFLGKILQSLAKQKLLTSTKGPNGGFGLGKEPSKIKLIDIVDIVDGKEAFTECLLSHKNCDHEEAVCPVHDKYSEIREQYYMLFKKTTLSSLMKDMKNNEATIVI